MERTTREHALMEISQMLGNDATEQDCEDALRLAGSAAAIASMTPDEFIEFSQQILDRREVSNG